MRHSPVQKITKGRAKSMKQKIRMPFGAAFACILITIVIIVTAFAGCRYIPSSCTNSNPEPQVTDEADVTNTPNVTNEPIRTNPPAETNSPNPDQDGEQARFDMIDRCMETVVSIDSSVRYNGELVVASSGSGVIISENGYIITCEHVISDADAITVYLNDGTEYDAELIGSDSIKDLAVIKITGNGFTYANYGDSSTLRIGESVFAIGNALGTLSNTYTTGSISGINRNVSIEGRPMTLLQTDAAINHGNSGGALFRTSDGSLIGIVNAKSDGSGIEGLGFAIPIDLAGDIASDLINYGYVTGRPYLGISTIDTTLYGSGGFFYAPRYTFPKVTSVEEGSPAADAGIQVNDIIVSVDGQTISSSDDLYIAISGFESGSNVTLKVLRNNRYIEIQVTIRTR